MRNSQYSLCSVHNLKWEEELLICKIIILCIQNKNEFSLKVTSPSLSVLMDYASGGWRRGAYLLLASSAAAVGSLGRYGFVHLTALGLF